MDIRKTSNGFAEKNYGKHCDRTECISDSVEKTVRSATCYCSFCDMKINVLEIFSEQTFRF